MPSDVEIQEVQAEIEERRSLVERQARESMELPDMAQLIRETTARDAWKAARLSAD